MRRRDFIAAFGGAAAMPLAARAQERMRRVGILVSATADDPEFQARVGAFLQGLQQLGWSIGRNVHIDTLRQSRRSSQARGGIGRARARRHPGPWVHDRWAVAASDARRAGCVSGYCRPGRCRLRRQPGAAGWQRHRVHDFRIQPGREMAGAAQADRPRHDASGSPSRSRHAHRPRPVRHHPGRGAVGRGGGHPGQYARRARDRGPRSRASCRSRRRPSTSWSSISRLPRRSASPCRQHYSPAPMR